MSSVQFRPDDIDVAEMQDSRPRFTDDDDAPPPPPPPPTAPPLDSKNELKPSAAAAAASSGPPQSTSSCMSRRSNTHFTASTTAAASSVIAPPNNNNNNNNNDNNNNNGQCMRSSASATLEIDCHAGFEWHLVPISLLMSMAGLVWAVENIAPGYVRELNIVETVCEGLAFLYMIVLLYFGTANAAEYHKNMRRARNNTSKKDDDDFDDDNNPKNIPEPTTIIPPVRLRVTTSHIFLVLAFLLLETLNVIVAVRKIGGGLSADMNLLVWQDLFTYTTVMMWGMVAKSSASQVAFTFIITMSGSVLLCMRGYFFAQGMQYQSSGAEQTAMSHARDVADLVVVLVMIRVSWDTPLPRNREMIRKMLGLAPTLPSSRNGNANNTTTLSTVSGPGVDVTAGSEGFDRQTSGPSGAGEIVLALGRDSMAATKLTKSGAFKATTSPTTGEDNTSAAAASGSGGGYYRRLESDLTTVATEEDDSDEDDADNVTTFYEDEDDDDNNSNDGGDDIYDEIGNAQQRQQQNGFRKKRGRKKKTTVRFHVDFHDWLVHWHNFSADFSQIAAIYLVPTIFLFVFIYLNEIYRLLTDVGVKSYTAQTARAPKIAAVIVLSVYFIYQILTLPRAVYFSQDTMHAILWFGMFILCVVLMIMQGGVGWLMLAFNTLFYTVALVMSAIKSHKAYRTLLFIGFSGLTALNIFVDIEYYRGAQKASDLFLVSSLLEIFLDVSLVQLVLNLPPEQQEKTMLIENNNNNKKRSKPTWMESVRAYTMPWYTALGSVMIFAGVFFLFLVGTNPADHVFCRGADVPPNSTIPPFIPPSNNKEKNDPSALRRCPNSLPRFGDDEVITAVCIIITAAVVLYLLQSLQFIPRWLRAKGKKCFVSFYPILSTLSHVCGSLAFILLMISLAGLVHKIRVPQPSCPSYDIESKSCWLRQDSRSKIVSTWGAVLCFSVTGILVLCVWLEKSLRWWMNPTATSRDDDANKYLLAGGSGIRSGASSKRPSPKEIEQQHQHQQQTGSHGADEERPLLNNASDDDVSHTLSGSISTSRTAEMDAAETPSSNTQGGGGMYGSTGVASSAQQHHFLSPAAEQQPLQRGSLQAASAVGFMDAESQQFSSSTTPRAAALQQPSSAAGDKNNNNNNKSKTTAVAIAKKQKKKKNGGGGGGGGHSEQENDDDDEDDEDEYDDGDEARNAFSLASATGVELPDDVHSPPHHLHGGGDGLHHHHHRDQEGDEISFSCFQTYIAPCIEYLTAKASKLAEDPRVGKAVALVSLVNFISSVVIIATVVSGTNSVSSASPSNDKVRVVWSLDKPETSMLNCQRLFDIADLVFSTRKNRLLPPVDGGGGGGGLHHQLHQDDEEDHHHHPHFDKNLLLAFGLPSDTTSSLTEIMICTDKNYTDEHLETLLPGNVAPVNNIYYSSSATLGGCDVNELASMCKGTTNESNSNPNVNTTQLYQTPPRPDGVFWAWEPIPVEGVARCANLLCPTGLPPCHGRNLYRVQSYAGNILVRGIDYVSLYTLAYRCLPTLFALVVLYRARHLTKPKSYFRRVRLVVYSTIHRDYRHRQTFLESQLLNSAPAILFYLSLSRRNNLPEARSSFLLRTATDSLELAITLFHVAGCVTGLQLAFIIFKGLILLGTVVAHVVDEHSLYAKLASIKPKK